MSLNSSTVGISASAIEKNKVLDLLETPPGHGAEIWFFGVVRNLNQEKSVLAVSYDAFVPLAEKTLKQICDEAHLKFGSALRMVVLHRLGRLEVGEVSLAIGVSSPHRDEAYQVSRFLIENIKHRAPIWKKEHYIDGDTEWLEGHALCGNPSA